MILAAAALFAYLGLQSNREITGGYRETGVSIIGQWGTVRKVIKNGKEYAMKIEKIPQMGYKPYVSVYMYDFYNMILKKPIDGFAKVIDIDIYRCDQGYDRSGFTYDEDESKYASNLEKSTYCMKTIMEYTGLSIVNKMLNYGPKDKKWGYKMTHQVLKAIKNLRACNYAHRKIDPYNITEKNGKFTLVGYTNTTREPWPLENNEDLTYFALLLLGGAKQIRQGLKPYNELEKWVKKNKHLEEKMNEIVDGSNFHNAYGLLLLVAQVYFQKEYNKFEGKSYKPVEPLIPMKDIKYIMDNYNNMDKIIKYFAPLAK